MLDATGIALALWMRQRYFCTLYEAVKTILPAGLWYQLREVWHTVSGEEAAALAAGIPGGQAVWDALTTAGGSADAQVLENACGEETQRVLRALRKAGAVTCETEAKRKLGDKTRRMVQLALSAEEALDLTQPAPAQCTHAIRGGAAAEHGRKNFRRRALLFYRRISGNAAHHGKKGTSGLFRRGGAAGCRNPGRRSRRAR